VKEIEGDTVLSPDYSPRVQIWTYTEGRSP